MNKNINTFEFTGVPSGDYESFCFDVTRDDYIKIEKDIPDEEFDASKFNNGLYRLYPDTIFPKLRENKPLKYKIIVEVTEE